MSRNKTVSLVNAQPLCSHSSKIPTKTTFKWSKEGIMVIQTCQTCLPLTNSCVTCFCSFLIQLNQSPLDKNVNTFQNRNNLRVWWFRMFNIVSLTRKFNVSVLSQTVLHLQPLCHAPAVEDLKYHSARGRNIRCL